MQNVRIWIEEIPHVIQQVPLHSVKVAPNYSLQNFKMCYKTVHVL
jgi:hypothetical protein